MINKLRGIGKTIERTLLGITSRNRIRYAWIQEKTKMKDITITIVKRKWRCMKQVVRSENVRQSKEILNWYLLAEKRRMRRPRKRWDEGGLTQKKVANDKLKWKRMDRVYTDVCLDNDID